MRRNFIFFFLRAGGLPRVLEGWGGGGARDCERGPQNAVASRSHLSVCPGFEYISMFIYCIFCRLTPILRQFDNIESKSDSKFMSLHTFLIKEKPIM